MADSFHLADVLGEYVSRSGYTPGQLARLTSIPKPTIVNWLEGRVKRPRGHEELLRLAAVLHLDIAEATLLLQTADHSSIQELQERARQDGDTETLALLTPWADATLSRSKPAPFQAMADLPYFVGREAEIQALTRALISAEHETIYTLQGMGGVGKTVLAVRLTYLLRPHFPDGILWARVDTADTMAILSTFASAYGLDVSQYVDVHSRSRVVRELLATKRALIVLDNVQSSESVQPLLPPTGTCAVLLTTRRHDLSVMRGARRFLLGPFSEARGESIALFTRILGEERATTEQETLAELSTLLGHLPLAIDIVASRLAYEPGWSTADFLHRLRRRRLAELAYEDQSVRLSFDASYEALEPAEQQFLTTLSLFEGEDFSDEAAAHAAGLPLEEAQDHLRRLYGLSLVQQGRPVTAGQPVRYRMHRLLRDYTRLYLEDEQAVTRLVTYFVHYVELNQRHYQALDREMPDILTSLQAAADRDMTLELVHGINALYHFLEARGLYEVAARYLAQARVVAPQLDDTAVLLKVTHWSGRLAQRQGEYIEAEAQYEAALALARDLGDQESLSHILRALGVLAARRGDYVLADAYYKEGLALAREFGYGGAVSNFLRGLGVQAYVRGDFARAEAFYEEGLALLHVDDEPEAAGEGGMLWGLGMLAQEQGDEAQAEAYYQQALQHARTAGYQERVIMLLRNLGGLYSEQGRYATAEPCYQEALALAREIGHRWQVGRVLSEWGELQLAQGRNQVAAAAFRELFELARMLQSQELVAVALYGLARFAASQEDMAQARQQGRESLDAFVAIGHYKVQEVKAWLATLPG